MLLLCIVKEKQKKHSTPDLDYGTDLGTRERPRIPSAYKASG